MFHPIPNEGENLYRTANDLETTSPSAPVTTTPSIESPSAPSLEPPAAIEVSSSLMAEVSRITTAAASGPTSSLVRIAAHPVRTIRLSLVHVAPRAPVLRSHHGI
jgi:hypothetical protein